MKISRACLLLVALSALAPRAAQALNIDYTLSGLTAWNGGFGQQTAFDPTPDHPFQLTFNLNDVFPLIAPHLSATGDRVEFSGISPSGDQPRLSIAGAPPIEQLGGPEGGVFSLENPAAFDGEDLHLQTDGLPGTPRFYLDFSGPALFHYANGQATFETGTFGLTGQLRLVEEAQRPILDVTTPLADVALTAQSVPVPEGASWLLAASVAAGVGVVYGVRRGRLRPAPSALA
jgi:hypothetical protein